MKLVWSLAVAAILATTGCASTGGSSSAAPAMGSVSKDSVEAAIKSAEDAVKQASATGGTWRDADAAIAKAKEAATKGDLDAALKLAKQAEFQGKMGSQQAQEQTNAKPWLF